MISTSNAKLIRSLRLRRFREQHRLYVVEGEKMVRELINSAGWSEHRVQQVFATGGWINEHGESVQNQDIRMNEATDADLKKVSNMVTPQPVLALVSIPNSKADPELLNSQAVLGFEAIRDPGNLGTIIRTADWFGIRHILCTPDSVDAFNPKVVQSTMGAIGRVSVHYVDLETILSEPGMRDKAIFGTFLDGESIYGIEPSENPLILFGNESSGLSNRYDGYIRQRISIPSFAPSGSGSESLNVASSVAIVCSEIRRMR